MNTIAERISRRRKELGLTQKELSEILNVSDKALSRWETGKQIPDAFLYIWLLELCESGRNGTAGVISVFVFRCGAYFSGVLQ